MAAYVARPSPGGAMEPRSLASPANAVDNNRRPLGAAVNQANATIANKSGAAPPTSQWAAIAVSTTAARYTKSNRQTKFIGRRRRRSLAGGIQFLTQFGHVVRDRIAPDCRLHPIIPVGAAGHSLVAHNSPVVQRQI